MQFRFVAAEKNPIVFMNSLTGMPLSTWMFLNTSSAISGFSWPRTDTATSRPMSVNPRARVIPLLFRAVLGAERRIADRLHVVDHFRRHAHLLFGFLIGNPAILVFREHEWLGEHLRVVDCYDHLQVVVVQTGVALLDLRVDAVGMTG